MRICAHKPQPATSVPPATSAVHVRTWSGQNARERSILHLQRTVGNRAVHRLLQSQMIMRQEVAPPGTQGSQSGASVTAGSCPTASPPCEIPREPSIPGNMLPPAEVTRRRAVVQRLISAQRPSYPLAAANLQHWLDGTGAAISMPAEPFQRSDSGVARELTAVHWPVIRQGILRRLRDRGDAETLATPGTVRTIHYWHSIRADLTATGTEGDLSIALGGYAVTSYVTVRSTGTRADILSWCIQVCDSYDWNKDAIAPVQISGELGRRLASVPDAPGRVLFPHGRQADRAYYLSEDNWFRDLEASGVGRRYRIRTGVFSMPNMPSRVP